MKLLYLDTETTGLTDNSAIVQIAGAIEIDGEVVEWFNIRCKPHVGADISENALQTIGLTLEELNKEQSPADALKELESIFSKYVNRYDKNDKLIMICHNYPFDFRMLFNFYNRLNNKYMGSFLDFKLNVCTLNLIRSLQVIGILPILENNKLETWCKHFNVKLENAHDALEDIRATREVYLNIAKLLKKS
jgi:DNA polymerase-3 subunit epsilon